MYASLEGGRVKTKRSSIREGELFACARTLEGSHRRCTTKESFLKKFAKVTEKKGSGLRAATLLKKQPQQRCFLVNFENVFRIPILQNDS